MKQTIMKRKYEYHKNLTTMNKKIFYTRYGQITVTVVCDKTITVVHNRLEFQIPHTMSADALLKWKVTNQLLLEQLRKDERIN
jgi:D-serine dehydratase